MSDLSKRLVAVRERIATAARVVGREPDEVELLLSVKQQDAARVRHVVADGAHLLGHNREQELTAMAAELGNLPHEMHFIGHLQSNKAGKVVPLVSCVQSVGSFSLAERLDRLAGNAERILQVFIQVNTSEESTKGGIGVAEAHELAAGVGALPHLHLRGLMTIGANSPDVDVVRSSYERLALLRDEIAGSGAPGTSTAVELSMGMSQDLEIAIAAGATMVRVGTGVFGPRGGTALSPA